MISQDYTRFGMKDSLIGGKLEDIFPSGAKKKISKTLQNIEKLREITWRIKSNFKWRNK